jgi:hypothetical protein
MTEGTTLEHGLPPALGARRPRTAGPRWPLTNDTAEVPMSVAGRRIPSPTAAGRPRPRPSRPPVVCPGTGAGGRHPDDRLGRRRRDRDRRGRRGVLRLRGSETPDRVGDRPAARPPAR